MGHYIENTDDRRLRFLEMFRSDRFADVSLKQWMALTPPELVREHLRLGEHAMAALRYEKEPVVRPITTMSSTSSDAGICTAAPQRSSGREARGRLSARDLRVASASLPIFAVAFH
jgi:hypothetical protein